MLSAMLSAEDAAAASGLARAVAFGVPFFPFFPLGEAAPGAFALVFGEPGVAGRDEDLVPCLGEGARAEPLPGIAPGDLEWCATGERLTAATFAEKRAGQGGTVIVHSIPEHCTDRAIRHPRVMIASDAIP